MSTGSTHKTLTFTHNRSVRRVIRATSNPCQQETPNDLDGIYGRGGISTVVPVDACKVNNQPTAAEVPSLDLNGTTMESREVRKQPSTRRARGRPKKRVRHTEMNGQSISNSLLKMLYLYSISSVQEACDP